MNHHQDTRANMNNFGNKFRLIGPLPGLLCGPYEIDFNHYFYPFTPLHSLENIEADLKQIEHEIAYMLAEGTE
jgi:hypothetical protein